MGKAKTAAKVAGGISFVVFLWIVLFFCIAIASVLFLILLFGISIKSIFGSDSTRVLEILNLIRQIK